MKFKDHILKTGYVKSKGLTQIGFIFDDLSASQLSYTMIVNTNEWLKNNFGTNVNIFYIDNFAPPIIPRFSRFNIKEIYTFEGSLIGTSAKSTFPILNARRSKRYFYVQDLECLRQWHNPEQWNNVMRDDSVIKFCRSKDHYDWLVKHGYNINKTIVEDFNLNKILEIINASKSNEC